MSTAYSPQPQIRIESLVGPIPTEAFLRAVNDLYLVAAEVGRTLGNVDFALT